MTYVNHNYSLFEIQSLVSHQNMNLDTNNKSSAQDLLFEIEKILEFNRSLTWNPSLENTHLLNSMEDAIKIFQLRSRVFSSMGYLDEFPDKIPGLNFDKYDQSSAITFYQRDNNITGTCRLIFDNEHGLPAEKQMSFDKYRERDLKIGEISRNIVEKTSSGLNLEFRSMMASMHDIFIHNELDLTLSGILKSNIKLFSKFGGIKVEKEIEEYGKIDGSCVIIAWNPSKKSKFFKKAFLKEI